MTASGQVLDAKPIVVRDTAEVNGVGLAANGRGVELVWSGPSELGGRHGCVYDVQLRNDGTPASAPRELACSDDVLSGADLVWDGGEYVGVWADPATVQGLRLGVDSEPFQVNPPGTSASQPSIAASAGGATFAYVRVSAELGSVDRVFTRTLERAVAPPRRRPSR